MIVTYNGSNSYTITEPAATIATYNLTTAVYIDDVLVSNTIPYTHIFGTGVFDLKVVMTNINTTFTDKYCLLNDTSLYCSIITKLSKMKEADRLNSNMPYLYFLLDKGQSSNTCTCLCENVKSIYSELKQLLDDTTC
jgi:hypothetical protein